MTLRFLTHLLSFKKIFWTEKYFLSIVAVIALASMIISLSIGLHQSVWFDEGYSIILAQRPVHELISLTMVDAHPPLYYLLLKGWLSTFGTSEFALRTSSVLCGGLSVMASAFLLKELFSKRIALMAIPFVAFAPFLIRYNYEIRMYALVTLIGVASTWILVRAWRTKQAKWWVMYGLLVVAGMYTLYMSAVFWLAHLVWLFWMTRQAKQSFVRQPYWIVYAGAAVAFLPWVPTVIKQLGSSALPPFMDAVTINQLVNILGLLMVYHPGWQIDAWLSVLLVLFLVTFVYVYAKLWQRITKSQRRGLLLLSMCFIVGILFYAAISLPPNPPRFLDRYVVHISIFWYALLGVIIAYGWQLGVRRSTAILTAVTVMTMGYGIVAAARIGNYNFQRVQYLQAKLIRQEIGCDNTTFVTAGPFGYVDMKYDFRDCQLKFYYPRDVTFTGGFAPVNGSNDWIKDTRSITSQRVVFVYYDDSDVSLVPDGRFHEIERRSFDKTHIITYAQ